MPLVAHIPLPNFSQLRDRGVTILTLEQARRQDIRKLHVGILNMMPDAAFHITEQQFIRLVGSSDQVAQIYVHPFTIQGLVRSLETQHYIDKYYSNFEQIQSDGLDALIITGANVVNPRLQEESFWKPLAEVMNWAIENVASILCSCLATHALVKQIYNIDRKRLPRKRWGVYRHRVTDPDHPLLRDTNTHFDVPHSRHNEVASDQLKAAGLHILVESVEGEAHMAVSHDQFRIVYFQGHPEYYRNSLLKEYKREVTRFFNAERQRYPSHPQNYFVEKAAAIADNYRKRAIENQQRGKPLPPFPENQIEKLLENTWGETSKTIINNWLGLIYGLTNLERRVLFRPGVNPDDPLGFLKHNPVE